MRKIYEEYLYVPEEGQGVVREKVFFSRLAISIVCMAICMIAMGYNAYAYFTANIESTANVIQAATYSTKISVASATPNEGTVKADAQIKGRYTLTPGRYNFTVTKEGTSSTGYCRIDVDEVNENGAVSFKSSFYTQQLGKVVGSEELVNERTILISVDKDIVIQFVDCWGTYAGAESNETTYLKDNEGIQVKDNRIAKEVISNLTKATASTGTQTDQPQPTAEQPESNNGGEESQQNVALPQQSTEVKNEKESSESESNAEPNTGSQEQSGEGEQSPTENPQTQ